MKKVIPFIVLVMIISFPILLSNILIWNGKRESENISYVKLESLLAKSKWKEADKETEEIIKKAFSINYIQISLGDTTIDFGKRYFWSNEIPHFPCKVLLLTDRLWNKYSNNRFSFKNQLKIWQQISEAQGIKRSESLKLFAKELNWDMEDYHKGSSISFDLKSPVGHLPSLLWIYKNRPPQHEHGIYPEENIPTFYSRVNKCYL